MRFTPVIVCIFLGGCLVPEDSQTTSSNDSWNPSSANTSDTTVTSTTSTTGQNPLQMVWSKCHAAGTSFRWPNGEGPQGRNPRGWSNETEDIDNQWFLELMICDKFAVGPFERGPLAMAFEFHNQFTPPPGCKEGPRFDQMSALQWLYIDDPQVGQFLKDEMGMPVVEAEIRETVDATAPLNQNTWELITTEGRSYMTAGTFGPEYDEPLPWIERLFWSQGDELWQMDLTENLMTEAIGGDATAGEMYPPTLYGSWRAGAYASVVTIYSDFALEAKLTHYGDLKCNEHMES